MRISLLGIMRKNYIIISLLILSALLYSYSYFEPPTGYPWWGEILGGGDWSLQIGEGEYLIGNDVNDVDKQSGPYMIFRYDLGYLGNNQYIFDPTIWDVVLYNNNDTWIVAKTKNDYKWLSIKEGKIHTAKDFEELKELAPNQVISLAEDLKEPKPSGRSHLRFYSVLLLFIAIFLVIRKAILKLMENKQPKIIITGRSYKDITS